MFNVFCLILLDLLKKYLHYVNIMLDFKIFSFYNNRTRWKQSVKKMIYTGANRGWEKQEAGFINPWNAQQDTTVMPKYNTSTLKILYR